MRFSLRDEGHRAATAIDGIAALDLVERGTIRPDLVLSDYNLPNGLDGLQLAAQLRKKFHHQIPIIILTGDISAGTLRDIALQGCFQLNKPVKLQELAQSIQRLLSTPQAIARVHSPKQTEEAGSPVPPTIFVVDDDRSIRDAIRGVLEEDGRIVEDYAACEEFLEAYQPGREACLVIDAYLPGMDGFELLRRLSGAGYRLPAIMITGNSDVPMAVQAMKAGATDFIEKPVSRDELLASVNRALEQSRDSSKLSTWRRSAAEHVARLTAAPAVNHGFRCYAGRSEQKHRPRTFEYQPAHCRKVIALRS